VHLHIRGLFAQRISAYGDANIAWQPCYRIPKFPEFRPVALRPTLSVWFALYR
jgi:hypothetical protein